MIRHWRFVAVASIVAIAVAVSFIGGSDSNIVGIAGFSLLSISLFCSFFANRPHIGLLLCLITSHWMPLKGLSWSLYALAIVILISLIAFGVGDRKPGNFYWISTILVIGYNLILKLFAPYVVENVWFYIYGVAFLGLLWTERLRWDAKKLELIVLLQLIFMILFGFVERVVSNVERLEGPTISATAYGALMAILWSIWFSTALVGTIRSTRFLLFITVLVVVIIAMSGTRMGILGVILGGALGVFFQFAKQNHNILKAGQKFVLFSGLCFLCLLCLWFVLPDTLFIKNSFNLLNGNQLDRSSMGRVGAWLTALDLIPDHLVWGIGTGNFYEYNVLFLQRFAIIDWTKSIPRLVHAHNIYLIALCEQGLVGVSFILMLLSLALLRLIKRFRINPKDPVVFGVLAGGVVMAALGLIDAIPFIPSTAGWGGWFIGLMASRPEKDE